MGSEELLQQLNVLEKEFDESVSGIEKTMKEVNRVADIAHNTRVILDDLDEQFCQYTGLTKSDMVFLFVAVGLQLARQYFISNESFRLSAKQGDMLIENSLSMAPPSWQDVLTQSVPYDALKKGALVSTNTGLSGSTHRYRTLGHDPILGWIFGTANIMTNSLTKCNFETYQVKNMTIIRHFPLGVMGMMDKCIKYSIDDPMLLVTSIARQAIHFGSDYFTKQGLPIPIIATVNNDLAKDMLTKWNIDMYSITRGATLSVFINQIISIIHSLLFDPQKEVSKELYEVRTRKIILYSNLIASSSNVAIATFTSNFQLLDVGGLGVSIYRLITDTKFIRQVKEEFILGNYERMIMGDDYKE